jgi:hypothetical protein
LAGEPTKQKQELGQHLPAKEGLNKPVPG